MILLNIAGWARPVRIVAKSSLATVTAFSIFSSASSSVSSIIGASSTHAFVSGCPSGVGRHDVPIFSPRTARAMLPSSSRSKTTIGSSLSMQRLMAVASTTFSPRSEHLGVGSESNFTASGLVLGSAS